MDALQTLKATLRDGTAVKIVKAKKKYYSKKLYEVINFSFLSIKSTLNSWIIWITKNPFQNAENLTVYQKTVVTLTVTRTKEREEFDKIEIGS